MNEKLTWDEIKAQHPDEWVALVDYDWPNMGRVTAGIVHSHHPDKKKLMEMQHGLKDAAILWTGKMRGMALMAVVDVDGDIRSSRT